MWLGKPHPLSAPFFITWPPSTTCSVAISLSHASWYLWNQCKWSSASVSTHSSAILARRCHWNHRNCYLPPCESCQNPRINNKQLKHPWICTSITFNTVNPIKNHTPTTFDTPNGPNPINLISPAWIRPSFLFVFRMLSKWKAFWGPFWWFQTLPWALTGNSTNSTNSNCWRCQASFYLMLQWYLLSIW